MNLRLRWCAGVGEVALGVSSMSSTVIAVSGFSFVGVKTIPFVEGGMRLFWLKASAEGEIYDSVVSDCLLSWVV